MKQYHIYYQGQWIESTGYFLSEAAAYKWATERYGTEGITVKEV